MSIEHMFESPSPGVLLGEIESTHHEESILMARRLAAIAELLGQRIAEVEEVDPDPGYMMVTGFARTTAEVSAAMNMSPMATRQLVGQAEDLDSRLPKVGRLLAEGKTDWRTVQLVISRTEFVDSDVIAKLDKSLARQIGRWDCWSRRRIINKVDAAVRSVDPDAVKDRRVAAYHDRNIGVTGQPDGMAKVHGTLPATAAAAFDKRLSQLAMSVCAKDPRTVKQRRADAVTALMEGQRLPCACGTPDCPANTTEVPAPPVARPVINVIASECTLTGESDQPGYVEGFGVVDADQVRELAVDASWRMVDRPQVTPEEALRYHPSAAVERWVRFRDLTCRFPGCDRPAAHCDLDHTVPFNHDDPAAGGLTVPWNLACYCREHHRLKTFHGGPGGWRDEQLPDGTIVWTSPTGRTYRTTPGGADLFPEMCLPCEPPKPRLRNRSEERAARIAKSRKKLQAQRPVNAERRRVNRACREEIRLRRWRNQSRRMLILFKGGTPSTSPWCPWINEPFEPEELPPEWEPPPEPPPLPDDDPPF